MREVERVAREIAAIIMDPQDRPETRVRRLARWHLREKRRARGRKSRTPVIGTPSGVPCRIKTGRTIKRWFRGAHGIYEGPCVIVPSMVNVRIKRELVAFEPRDVILVAVAKGAR